MNWWTSGALPTFYGWTHESIESSIVKGESAPEGMAAVHTLMHNLPREMAALIGRQETVGACAVATLAAVNEGLGHLPAHGGDGGQDPELKSILKVPDGWDPIWVSWSAIRRKRWKAAASARGCLSRRFISTAITASRSRAIPKLVEDLQKEGLIREQMPKPGRFEELKHLARAFGFPL